MEIVVPFFYQTKDKPQNPNNYSVWFPIEYSSVKEGKIYIQGKWFSFIDFVTDNARDEYMAKKKEENLDNQKIVSDKEYSLIKAIRELLEDY